MPEREFSYFDIDIHRLEEEWLRQLLIYRKHSQKLADAEDSVRRAEAELEVRKNELKKVVAELDLDIRRDSTIYGLEKPSPKEAVDNVIFLQKSYIKAQKYVFDGVRLVNEAKHDAAYAKTDVDTLRQKKEAIQDLIVLQGREYFATPNLPHQLGGKRMADIEIADAFHKRRQESD